MATFHLFPQLPTELRLAIWRFCLPYRVHELDYQRDDLLFGPERPCAKNKALTNANTCIPALSRVNREARSVALESWQPLPLPLSDSPEMAYWASEILPEPAVDSHRTQFIHLNWAPAQEGDADWSALGDPLRFAMWIADQMPESKISLNASLLEDAQYSPNGLKHPWTREELKDLMRQRKSFTVVLEPIIFIHSNLYRATQAAPFSLLGDAPVQIVHTNEEARLNSFMELGRQEGIKLSSDPLEKLKDRLQDLSVTVTTIFGSGNEDALCFVPAVMFRYCPYNCSSN